MSQEFVILVDENDNELGTMEKMEAHEKALLHRAFSVLIYKRMFCLNKFVRFLFR